ncbi:hypothetical protein FGB62_54g221 [Gracilaria domingensis]|nr:hypothetical protein FGB62_54g221 [Gracilaria domingensis]
MANGSPQAPSTKDLDDSAAEHMEGITAPPASPADANPSAANRAADKEADRLALNDSTTLKHREITSPDTNATPPGHVQAASTMVVHPEQAVIISSETNSDSRDKPTLRTTPSKPSAAPSQTPMNKQNSDSAEDNRTTAAVKPPAHEVPNDEHNSRHQSDGEQSKQRLEDTDKERTSSHTLVPKMEAEGSVLNQAPDSSTSTKREPQPASNTAAGLSGSDKPEPSPTEPQSKKSDENLSEAERAADSFKQLDDEKELFLGKAGTTTGGRKAKESAQEEIPRSPQHSSKGQVVDRMETDSTPDKDSGTRQGQSVVKEDAEEAQKAKKIEDHPSEAKMREGTEHLSSTEHGEDKSNNDGGVREARAVGNAEISSNDAEPNDSGKESVADVDNPLVLNPKSLDTNEGNTKSGDLQEGVEKKENDGSMRTSVGDEPSNSKQKAVPTIEKTEPMEEAPASEQAASPMEIDSANQETESIAKEVKADEGKGSENIKALAGKSPINGSKTGDKVSEDVAMGESTPSRADNGLDKRTQAEDENTAHNKKSRKNVRKALQSRLLRTRSTSRGGAPDSSFDSSGKQDSTPQEAGKAPIQKSSDTASQASKGKEGGVPEDDGPRPVMEAKGLTMRVANAVFVTEDQLDEPKIARLKDKKVLPFERLTFKELRTYNRDQLRAYCFAYGMERRKKTEMEADMARYLSYWNRGKPGFALHEYVPTSGRIIDIDEFFGNRSSQPNQSAASLGGTSYSGVDANRRFGSRGQSASGTYADKGSGAGMHGSGSGNLQTSPSTPSAGNANRSARAGSTPTSLPRGFGTSFKQRVHARQASAKFKAAYNGAGDTIVNVVENAAAYFEGKDTPEVIADQTKSFERYQFNVDLLTEIFDGPIEEEVDVPKVGVVEANGNMEGTTGQQERSSNATTGAQSKTDIMFDIAKRLLSNKRSAHKAELDSFETNLNRAEEKAKHTERRNMRLFQKLERAETVEQVEAIKKEFETEFGTPVDVTSRPVIRRKIDKTLPPLVVPDDQSRILRFTFL